MWHQFLSQFHFQQPLWLLLVLPLAGLSYLGWRGTRGRSHWSEVCDPELLPLLVREGRASSRTGLVLAMLVSLLLALAAAQPVWQKQPRPAFKQGGAVVIALDLSASMNATDIKPSRLQRARFKIEDLLSRMGDSQVALLVYAGDAFAVTPLTEDSDTVRAQLPAMVPEIMPAQGSRADRALKLAAGMLQQAGVQGGDILLVSDEVEPAQIASSLSRLREQGIKTSILAVGTEQGAPIPTAAGPLKDRQGQVILAKTSRAQMLEAASLGGGEAVFMSHDDRDLVRLIGGFDRGDKLREHTVTEVEHWVAEGPWLVLLALPLILPLFRRGLLQLMLPAALLIGFGTAPVAEAEPAERVTDSAAASGLWQQLWQTDDQRAARQYAAGDTSAAAQTFSDPRWKQLAQYESGDFDAALAALAAPETAADWYNRGNVLARKGELDSAIAAYDQALTLQPDLADAEHNRSLLQQLKNQQQSQQSDKSDQGQSGQDQPDQEQASQRAAGLRSEPRRATEFRPERTGVTAAGRQGR